MNHAFPDRNMQEARIASKASILSNEPVGLGTSYPAQRVDLLMGHAESWDASFPRKIEC
jgi:hypothetical protein